MTGENVQSEVVAAWLLDSMSTAVLVFDARLQLTYLNHAGEVLFEGCPGSTDTRST